ncbi:MAG: adenylyltransferase/cytidyltransferase family protein [Candidatus Thorarchaeota archaeon]|jgi:D-beta-D-heptose 7-phosphate kinase/D-beta-D-heptose 1-phosphate adenosyltransferase
MNDKIIMVSGGFDPLHIGHIQLMTKAAEYGKLIVVVNSDDWLHRKKGYVFMPIGERCAIIAALACVHNVYPIKESWMIGRDVMGNASLFSTSRHIQDDDETAIDAIRILKPDYFANGGDRTKKNVPEQAICDALSVEMLWGVGGEDKPQSSSELVRRAMKQLGK